MMSGFIIPACLAWGLAQSECFRATQRDCEDLAWELALERSLIRPPLCSPVWMGFRF